MRALLETAYYVLVLYWWVVICAVIASWLLNFGIINRFNRIAMSVVNVLDGLTQPVMRPIRRVIPDLGGIDISPVIVLIIIYFLQRLISDDLLPLTYSLY